MRVSVNRLANFGRRYGAHCLTQYCYRRTDRRECSGDTESDRCRRWRTDQHRCAARDHGDGGKTAIDRQGGQTRDALPKARTTRCRNGSPVRFFRWRCGRHKMLRYAQAVGRRGQLQNWSCGPLRVWLCFGAEIGTPRGSLASD